jgi:hypothetical protein
MVAAAREAATAAGMPIRVVEADVLSHDEPAGSVGLVYFTYDVYSFLADAERRVTMLRRMRRWLRPHGRIALSARTARRAYQGWILTLLWLGAHARGRRVPWGACHTRWLASDGTLRRSFVHCFTRRALRSEIGRAGLHAVDDTGGHLWLAG